MGLHETDLNLSDEYIDELQVRYGLHAAQDISTNWQHADLSSHYFGGKILFSKMGAATATHERPVMYVPGFTEGIVAKAPFGADLAALGYEVVIPGQHRKKILRDAANKKDATHTQAINYLEVIDQSGFEDGEFDLVTHSYGSLIFQAMQKISRLEGRDRFKNARVAMLAPAGVNQNEGLFKLGGRFAHNLHSDMKSEREFPDPSNEMLMAGVKNSIANIPRTVREVWHLVNKNIDFEELATSGISKAIVFGYAEDKLFPHRVLESGMSIALQHGVEYATPIAPRLRNDEQRSGKYAEHNDEQSNPRRVALAVDDFLQN